MYLPEVPGADQMVNQVQRRLAITLKTSGEPAAITAAVRRAVRELDATIPLYDVRPMPVSPAALVKERARVEQLLEAKVK